MVDKKGLVYNSQLDEAGKVEIEHHRPENGLLYILLPPVPSPFSMSPPMEAKGMRSVST